MNPSTENPNKQGITTTAHGAISMSVCIQLNHQSVFIDN